MAETNINQNRDQELTNSLDVSKSSDQQKLSQSQQTREWGPGTPKYYMDTMASYTPLQPQNQEPVEQKQAPEKLSALKTFAKKVMKALNRENDEKLVDETVEEVEETEAKAKQKSESVQNDNLVRSMGDKINEIKKEAEAEYEETKDPMTRMLVDLTDQLEKELQKETFDWNKIDLLVRQIAILLVQKMANNDQVTVQEEIKMMQQDVEKVRETFNTKWELALGITSGVISIAGGLVGLGSGVGGLAGAVSEGLMKTLGNFSNGADFFSKGIAPFKGIAENNAQKDRQLYMYEKERDQSHKQTTESSLQGNRSLKGSQMSQRDRAIEAAYRAFIQLAQ